MSKIIICDCCGDKISPFEDERSLKMETSNGYDDIIKEDICKNCYDKIFNFIITLNKKS